MVRFLKSVTILKVDGTGGILKHLKFESSKFEKIKKLQSKN